MISRISFRRPKSLELILPDIRPNISASASPSFTVFIGKNGTMKSAILGEIARHYSGFKSSSSVRIESHESRESEMMNARVIAFSSVLNDKFPLPLRSPVRDTKTRRDGRIYFYFGPRRNWNGSTAQKLRVVLEALLVNTDVDRGRTNLLETFGEIGLYPSIELRVSIEEKHTELSGTEMRRQIVSALVEEIRRDQDFDQERPEISEIAEDIARILFAVPRNAKRINVVLDLTISQGEGAFRRKIRAVLWAQKLGMVRVREVSMFSIGFGTRNVSRLSSGEANFVLQILAIASTVVDGSVVLIDEPETSLHPEWQMKYVRILQALLSKQSSCHVYLATHSPFILSSLPEATSTVVALESSHEGEIAAKTLEIDTFGWSVERLLIEVFHVRTFRNSYLDTQLRLLISEISSRELEVSMASERVGLLRKHVSGNADPLAVILDKIEDRIRNGYWSEVDR